jgi:AcrR family transcriptional regulator
VGAGAKINVLHTTKKQIIECSSFIFAKRWDFGFAESGMSVGQSARKVGVSTGAKMVSHNV